MVYKRKYTRKFNSKSKKLYSKKKKYVPRKRTGLRSTKKPAYRSGYRKRSWYRKSVHQRSYPRSANRMRIATIDPTTESFNLLPANMPIKMNFIHNQSLSPTVGELDHDFRMNAVYDPNVSITGDPSAMWYHQIKPYYHHYVVLGAKISTTFRWDASGANGRRATLCYLIPSDDLAGLGQDTPAKKQMVFGKQTKILEIGEESTVTIHFYYSAKDFFNQPEPLSDKDQYGSFDINSDPTKIAYIRAGVQTLDGGAASAVMISTKISYHARCIQPVDTSPVTMSLSRPVHVSQLDTLEDDGVIVDAEMAELAQQMNRLARQR